MIVAESSLGRHLIGRLDRATDLTSGLVDVCRAHGVRGGEVRATGALESVEVAQYDQGQRAWKPGRAFAGGGLELLSLLGTICERDGALTLEARVAVMRDHDSGVELLGGRLLSGRAFAVEFVIECFDDLILRRGTDQSTGMSLLREAIPLVAPTAHAHAAPAHAEMPAHAPPAQRAPEEAHGPAAAAPPAGDWPETRPPPVARRPERSAVDGPSWEQVAAASKPEDEDEIPEEDNLGPGDIIVHPTFGRCDVQRIEGAYEFAHVRLKNGRLVRLSLDVLKLTPAGREADRRVFRARVDG